MSTSDTGDAMIAAEAVAQARQLLDNERAGELRQFDLLDNPTPEDMLDAKESLGLAARGGAIVAEARRQRQGRPRGARNKRTDDFERWILAHGQHPALTLMQIQATPTEVLVENSRRLVTRLKKGGKDRPDELVTFEEETLTYDAANHLRIRCADALMPYLVSKKPVALDLTFTGVADLVIEGVTHTAAEVADYVEGEYSDVRLEDEA